MNKNILVTGGTGFLGRRVSAALSDAGYYVSSIGSKFDLTIESVAHGVIESHQPDVVVHLAAVCGGIGANRSEPGRYFRKNIQMGINVIDSARLTGVKSLIMCGTVCSYPRDCPAPFQEDDLWNGYPEETNAPYGIAKKALFEMLSASSSDITGTAFDLCIVAMPFTRVPVYSLRSALAATPDPNPKCDA